MVFRISDLECVLSHFSLRTNIRLAEFLPGLACTHQLTAAPPGPSGAPEPCPTCWHPKSALGEHPQGLLYALNCAKMFLCMSPTPRHAGQCKEGHCTQSFLLWTHSLTCVRSIEVISTSCSLSVASPSQEFAALATLPMLNPALQAQPINLTSDLPRSCAWHAGSSSSTTGRRRFASLQESTPGEKQAPHVLGGCQRCSRAPPHHRTCLARGISLSMTRVGLPDASGNEILVRPAMGTQPAFNEFCKVGHEQDRRTQAATSSDITGQLSNI